MGQETEDLIDDVVKKVKAARKQIEAMAKAFQKVNKSETQAVFEFKAAFINNPIKTMAAAKKSIDALHKKIKKKDLLNWFKKQKSLSASRKAYETAVKDYNLSVKVYYSISKATSHDHTFTSV